MKVEGQRGATRLRLHVPFLAEEACYPALLLKSAGGPLP